MNADACADALVAEIRRGEPNDDIWQAAISLSEFIESDYDSVLDGTLRAIRVTTHEDTLAAIATCLLEHVLEHDFSGFDKVEAEIRGGNDEVLYVLFMSAKFGVSTEDRNSSRWDRLLKRHRRRLDAIRARMRPREESED